MLGSPIAIARNTPELQPAFVDSVKRQKDFEYANDPAYWVKPSEPVSGKSNSFLDWLAAGGIRMIFYLMVTVVVVLLMYRLLSMKNLLPFQSRSKSVRRTRMAVSEETEPDMDHLLSTAEQNGDFREAVRLQYLSLLYYLRDRNLIEYRPEWTNTNYLSMFRKHAQYPAFHQLTRIYEYVWYGGFDTDQEKYELIRGEFAKFRNNL